MSTEGKFYNRIERLRYLENFMKEVSGGILTSEIAAALGVSQDTVRRDLDFLSLIGVLSLAKVGRYWVLANASSPIVGHIGGEEAQTIWYINDAGIEKYTGSSAIKTVNSIKIVYCYARKDKKFLDELERHLAALKHSGRITTWHDREILPGRDWKHEIDTNLLNAHIVLLLVSSHFINSHYCYGVEMKRILRLRELGKLHIIPIILNSVDWKNTVIGNIQVLPSDGKPITAWRKRDEAFQDVIKGIYKVVNSIIQNPS